MGVGVMAYNKVRHVRCAGLRKLSLLRPCARRYVAEKTGAPMAKYEIPLDVIHRYGPFEEFKQDGSIVSVELANGRIFHKVLLVYPNEVFSVQGEKEMPFESGEVVRVFQTEEDLATRSSSNWVFFGA